MQCICWSNSCSWVPHTCQITNVSICLLSFTTGDSERCLYSTCPFLGGGWWTQYGLYITESNKGFCNRGGSRFASDHYREMCILLAWMQQVVRVPLQNLLETLLGLREHSPSTLYLAFTALKVYDQYVNTLTTELHCAYQAVPRTRLIVPSCYG